MGQRRVGKTVLIYHTIAHLIENGYNPRDIFYISLDGPSYTGQSLDDLLKMFLSGGDPDGHNTPAFVFFDEIQYLKGWKRHLKSLIDSPRYRNIQFAVSGSAGVALQRGSRESGAGRFTDFYLPPLTFMEYCDLSADTPYGRPDDEASITSLNCAFEEYLQYGGYPELALSNARSDPSRYIGSDVVEKVLLRDLPSLYGISDVQELNRLFRVLAWNTGQEISMDSLSKASHVAKNTLLRYMEYLETAFLIRRVERIGHDARHFKRAHAFKTYLVNPAIRTALFGPPRDEDMGLLVETALMAQTDIARAQIRYARWSTGGGGEVDMVELGADLKPLRITEVKWSDRFFHYPGDLGSLAYFYSHHRNTVTDLVVTTQTKSEVKAVRDMMIKFQPAAARCAEIGLHGLGRDLRDWRAGVYAQASP